MFRLGEVELADPDPRFSLHDLSFGGCLRLAHLLGLRLPDVHVVGYVLPAAGTSALVAGDLPGMSEAAARAAGAAVERVRELLA